MVIGAGAGCYYDLTRSFFSLRQVVWMRELPLVEAMMIWLPIFWSPDGGGFNVSAARPPPVVCD